MKKAKYSYLQGSFVVIFLNHKTLFSIDILPCLNGSSPQKLEARSERYFAEIAVHRNALPHYNFFLKNIFDGIQFSKPAGTKSATLQKIQ